MTYPGSPWTNNCCGRGVRQDVVCCLFQRVSVEQSIDCMFPREAHVHQLKDNHKQDFLSLLKWDGLFQTNTQIPDVSRQTGTPIYKQSQLYCTLLYTNKSHNTISSNNFKAKWCHQKATNQPNTWPQQRPTCCMCCWLTSASGGRRSVVRREEELSDGPGSVDDAGSSSFANCSCREKQARVVRMKPVLWHYFKWQSTARDIKCFLKNKNYETNIDIKVSELLDFNVQSTTQGHLKIKCMSNRPSSRTDQSNNEFNNN